MLNVAFIALPRFALRNATMMLRAAGLRMGLRDRLRLARLLLGRPGFLRALAIPNLVYLRAGYLGGGSADAGLLARGRQLMQDDPPPAAAPA